MRITIEFWADHEIVLPTHYNHIVQGFIYHNITDKDYRTFLHGTGYQVDNKYFKLFTFSRLLGKFKNYPQHGRIGFQSPFTLVVSTAVEQFITDLAETLIKSNFCQLGNNSVKINSITVHKSIEPGEKLKIKMLSPMLAYSTYIEEGKKHTNYSSPWEKRFVDSVKNNLLSKHEAIYGNRPENEEFSLLPNGSQKEKFKKVINYKDTYIEAYAGIYWLRGNPELIKVAYDTGLGSKNSQGFGCWEVVG